MVDLRNSWVRFRTLPADILAGLPDHVRAAFEAGLEAGFDVELLCAGVKVPASRRARRRFVLVADDVGPASGGPIQFDLAALRDDVRLARRMFVVSSAPQPEMYVAAYAAAVEDLRAGSATALVVETRPAYARDWVRTLSALRDSAPAVTDISRRPRARARARADG